MHIARIAFAAAVLATPFAAIAADASATDEEAAAHAVISVVSVPVKDQAAAKRFYVEALGFVAVTEADAGNGMRWVQLAPAKGAQTSISLVTWFPDMKPGAIKGLVLDVADIAATRAKLVERTVEIGEIRTTPWGKFADFTDPDGNGWMLHQP